MKGHSTFTDFYFVITRDGEEVPLAFIEVKNTSIAVDLGSQLKPVAQAIREAHVVCETISNQRDIQVPFIFILTNSTFWSFGLAKRAGGKFSLKIVFKLILTYRILIQLSYRSLSVQQRVLSKESGLCMKQDNNNKPLYTLSFDQHE